MSETNARTVFVLGKEEDGNKTMVVVESGKEYSMDADTIVTYSDAEATFPYTTGA